MRRASGTTPSIRVLLLLLTTTYYTTALTYAQYFDLFQPTRAYSVKSRATSQRFEYGFLPDERHDGATEQIHIGDDPFAYLLGVSEREENRERSRTTIPTKRLKSSQASKSKNNKNTGNTYKDADKNLRDHESLPIKNTHSFISDNDIYKEIKPQKISSKPPGVSGLSIHSDSSTGNTYDSGNYNANQRRYDRTKPRNRPEYQSSFGFERPSYANRRPDISERPRFYTPDFSYSTEYPIFSNIRPDYNDEPYYIGPDNTYNRPDYSNNRPDNTFNRPDNTNNSTDNTYNTQSNTYNRSDNTFNIPDNTYNRPDNTNNRPDNTYNTQDNTYKRPDNTYRRPIQNPSNNQHATTARPVPGVRPAVAAGLPITNKPLAAHVPYTEQPIVTYTEQPIVTYTEQPIVTRGRPDDMVKFPGPDDGTPDLVRGPDVARLGGGQTRALEDYLDSLCASFSLGDTAPGGAAIPLLPAPASAAVRFNVSRCPPRGAPLIVGGAAVQVEHFPHAAELGWPNIESGGYSWKCGGSLVSDQFVLTAAHCAYQERDNTVVSGPPRVVQLGSSYLDDPGALVVRVAKVIRHPSYRIPEAYHDLALLKLHTAVLFSEVIRPACVGAPPPPGESIIAIGWGQTAYSGNTSRELRGVSLPVWRVADCARALGTSRKLPRGPDARSQLCAGDPRGERDTCQGDSGGGALVRAGCGWAVVGVTSLGRACGAPRTPALYAAAAPARAFIAAVIQRA